MASSDLNLAGALAGAPEPDHVPPVKTISTSDNLDHVLMLRSLLEGCGIKAYVPDELSAQTQPYVFANATTIRLQVEDEDAAAALAVLAQNGHAVVA